MNIIALFALPESLTISPGPQASELPKSITLERTYCFGSCPVYTATIQRSGKIHYHGEAHVQNLGDVDTTTSERDFERLAAKISKIGFKSFKTSYTNNFTDQSSAITSVKWGNRTKIVDVDGESGPDSLWELDAIIGGIVLSTVESQVINDHPERSKKVKIVGKKAK